jgi:hypothetical protein
VPAALLEIRALAPVLKVAQMADGKQILSQFESG